MAEIDSLTIKVTADTGSAAKNIKDVSDAVSSLQKVAKDKGLSNLQKSLSGLKTATKGLSNLSRAIASIEKINVSPKVKENLDKIADASARLSKVGKGIGDFGNGLSKISKMGMDSDLDKKFDAVAQSVGRFATALNDAVSDETLARLEKIADAMDKISRASENGVKISSSTGGKGGKGAVNTALKWNAIKNIAETANKTFSEIGSGLYGVVDSTGIIADFERMSGAITKNIPILGELTDAWKHEASEVKNILLSQANIVDKVADLMLVKVSHITKLLYSFAKLPFSPASMKLTASAINLVAQPVKNLAKNLTELHSKWTKWISSLSRIAIYRLIRTALKEIAQGIKEGVDNLYQWGLAWQGVYSSADKFVSSMNQVATAFLYLKNSVGAAVSPLIDYFAPVIDALVDKFVALANAINQAMAALTGATIWRKAIKYPVEYAEAASGASKKVKELERTVLAFDELNKLNDNKDRGGSGASSALDYSKMFEEMPVDSWLDALLNAPSWRGIGNIIANKINDALDSINWTKIQGTVRKWAKRFGSLFDEILLDLNMPLVGETIAQGLNTIADAINTFFDEFHWVTIGKHLSDGFESLIDTLRWGDIGRALTQKWKAVMELVIGFKDVDLTGLGKGIVKMFTSAIDNLPISEFVSAIEELMPKIATEIGIAFNGLMTKSNEVFDGLDAEGLGTSFTTALDNMLKQIDPAEAGKFLTNGIKKIIEFSTGVLKNESFWTELNTFVGETISNMFANIDLKTGVQNAIDLAQKMVDLLTTAVNSIPWSKIGEALESADTSKLKEGLKGLLESVVDGLEKAGVLDEVAGGVAAYIGLKLAGGIGKALPSIMTLGAAAKVGAGASGAAAGGGAISGALASMGGFGGMMTMDLGTIMGAGTATEIGVTLGTGILGGLAAAFGGGAVAKVIDNEVIAPILETFGSDSAKYYEEFHWFGDGGFFDYLGTAGEDVMYAKQEAVNNIFDSMTEKSNEAEKGVRTNLEEIPRHIAPVVVSLDDLKTAFSNTFDSILSKVSSVAKGIADKMKDIGKSFSDNFGLADRWEQIKESKSGSKSITSKTKGYASGGVVSKGDLFLAGEAGPEIVTSYGGDTAVMNMEQIIQTISASVAAASGGNITIPISLDGGLLDTVIVSAQQRQALRSGA